MTTAKMTPPQSGWRKIAVQAARPLRRCAAAIGGVATHAHGPFAAVAGITEDGQLQRLRRLRSSCQEVRHRLQAFAGGGADQRDGRAELAGQLQHIHLTALLVQLVSHVEQHQGGQSQGDDAPGQDQMAVQVIGVEDEDDRVGQLGAGHAAVEHIHRDALILRLGIEAVNAGQVNQVDLVAALQTIAAGVVLHGDAGEVANLLAQSGQAVEERGFAGIGRTDDGDRAIDGAAILMGRQGCGPGERDRRAQT